MKTKKAPNLSLNERRKVADIDFKKAGFVAAEALFEREIGKRGSQKREAFDAKARAWYFGELLRSRRQSLGLTQKALAEQLGRERTYINRIEKGETDMQLSSFLRIAYALGCDVCLEPRG